MTSTLLTAAIILGAVFIFIIFFIMLHKKGHNKKLEKQKAVFADCVWKNKLEISENETINNYLLAIDKLNFVLLYINFNEPTEVVHLIDLWNVKSAKVVTEDNSVYEYKKGKSILVDKHVSSLHLEVTLADNNQSKPYLLLYEYKDGMQDFVYIKRRATYWSEIINNSAKDLHHWTEQKVNKA